MRETPSRANHEPTRYSQAKLARDYTSIVIMAAIGSLVFCTDCGNLLENNTSRKTYLNCEVCGAQNKGMHGIKSYKLVSDRIVNTMKTPPAKPSPQPPSPPHSLRPSAHASAPTCKNTTRARSRPTPSSTTHVKNAATLRHATTHSNYDLPTKVAQSFTRALSARTSGTRITDRHMRFYARGGS
jgi:DNA-directed RNA polymerase subunit M/transcription elongation factor TFIIS